MTDLEQICNNLNRGKCKMHTNLDPPFICVIYQMKPFSSFKISGNKIQNTYFGLINSIFLIKIFLFTELWWELSMVPEQQLRNLVWSGDLVTILGTVNMLGMVTIQGWDANRLWDNNCLRNGDKHSIADGSNINWSS